jgi:uncharacterized protein YjbI with pentapeptide repeats
MPGCFMKLFASLRSFAVKRTGYFCFLLFAGVFVCDLLLWFFAGHSFITRIIVRNYARLVYGADKASPAYEEKYHQSFKEVVIGLGAIITLVFQFLREWNFNRQVKSAEIQTDNQTRQIVNQTRELEIRDQTRNDEQFKQAVEMLGDAEASLLKKQGAVFILVALATRSPEHTQRCVDMLCTLNEWMAERIDNNPDYFRLRDEKAKDEMGQDFKPWIERIFRRDKDFISLYAKYMMGIDWDWQSQPVLQRINTAMDTECLSQLVVKEMRKIIEEIGRRNNAIALTEPNSRHLDEFYYVRRERGQRDLLNLGNRYLCQLDISGIELHASVNFSYAILYGMRAQKTNTSKADFTGAQLRGADFDHGVFINTDFSRANLSYAHLNYAKMSYCKLEHATSYGADFEQTELQAANIRFALLQGARFNATQIQGADLGYAQLQGTLFFASSLQGAEFKNTDFKGAYFSFCRFAGMETDEESLLASAIFYSPDFRVYDHDWTKNLEDYVDSPMSNTNSRILEKISTWFNENKTISLPTDLEGWYVTLKNACEKHPIAVPGIIRNLNSGTNISLPVEIDGYVLKLRQFIESNSQAASS